jgi:hypothetical protein
VAAEHEIRSTIPAQALSTLEASIAAAQQATQDKYANEPPAAKPKRLVIEGTDDRGRKIRVTIEEID